MFNWFKKLGREVSVVRWMSRGHDPLFDTRETCESEIIRLESTIDFWVDLQKDLRDPEGKDEQQVIKEKWQALKIDTIMERYRLTISKLKDVVDNTPARPEITEYIVEYNDFDGPDDV